MTVVLGLAVFPLSAVPLWALGNVADDYNANGGFAVGQALVLAPAVGTMVVARSWAEWRWLPTLALSVACFFACGMAMLVAFVIVLPLFLDSFSQPRRIESTPTARTPSLPPEQPRAQLRAHPPRARARVVRARRHSGRRVPA